MGALQLALMSSILNFLKHLTVVEGLSKLCSMGDSILNSRVDLVMLTHEIQKWLDQLSSVFVYTNSVFQLKLKIEKMKIKLIRILIVMLTSAGEFSREL